MCICRAGLLDAPVSMGRSPHSRIAQEWTKLWTTGRASPRNHGRVRLLAQDAERPDEPFVPTTVLAEQPLVVCRTST